MLQAMVRRQAVIRVERSPQSPCERTCTKAPELPFTGFRRACLRFARTGSLLDDHFKWIPPLIWFQYGRQYVGVGGLMSAGAYWY
jgi:hypothetical protein